MDKLNETNHQMLQQLKLTEALYTIACESTEAEIVRLAFIGLVSTESGRIYLTQHPMAVS